MKIVTADDDGIRPAGSSVHCYYCNAAVGDPHGPECVTVTHKVRVAFTVELELHAPVSCSVDEIEFKYNESSWCASNLIGLLEEATKDDCLCGMLHAKYVSALEGNYDDEKLILKLVPTTPRRDKRYS